MNSTIQTEADKEEEIAVGHLTLEDGHTGILKELPIDAESVKWRAELEAK
jgi:hypothetical protein